MNFWSGTLFFLMVTCLPAFSQGPAVTLPAGSRDSLPVLPADFGEKAFAHVKNLAGIGIRAVGSVNEKKTMDYLQSFIKGRKLKLLADTFSFAGFEAGELDLFVHGRKISTEKIIFDPYGGPGDILAPSFFFDPSGGYKNLNTSLCGGRIILTTSQAEFYRLYRFGPKAIVLLSEKVYKDLDKRQDECRIRSAGKVQNGKSVNLSCLIGKAGRKEVILGAHWDSYKGPGADDNASGVSVLMELMRYYSDPTNSLPVNLRFIFFGAEELGELGSRAWVQSHLSDTANVLFFLNLDCVGDTGKLLADINCGVTLKKSGRLPAKDTAEPRACLDYSGKWLYLGALGEPMESNVPEWLAAAVGSAIEASGHPCGRMCFSGSDHRTFSAAGFPATDITLDGSNVQHCPGDDISQVRPASLLLAGRVVAGIIRNATSSVTQTKH